MGYPFEVARRRHTYSFENGPVVRCDQCNPLRLVLFAGERCCGAGDSLGSVRAVGATCWVRGYPPRGTYR